MIKKLMDELGYTFFFCTVLFWDKFPGMELFDKGMQGKGTVPVWEARLVIEGELKGVKKGEVCLPHSCQSVGPEVAATRGQR